jgi:hypothetical protein
MARLIPPPRGPPPRHGFIRRSLADGQGHPTATRRSGYPTDLSDGGVLAPRHLLGLRYPRHARPPAAALVPGGGRGGRGGCGGGCGGGRLGPAGLVIGFDRLVISKTELPNTLAYLV